MIRATDGQLELDAHVVDPAPYSEYTGAMHTQEAKVTELERVGRLYQRRRRALDEAHAELVPLIRDARKGDRLPLRRIARLTGLSFARIHQIEKEAGD